MCPWVGPHAPSFGRQLWGPPSRVEYLSPQGVLLPLVYGTTASPLWFELRVHSAWQATPSWTVYRLARHRLLPWLRVTFAMVPDAAWPGSDQWPWSTTPAPGPVGQPGRPGVSNPWGVGSFLSLVPPMCARSPGPLGSCSPVCSCGLLCRVCGVLGHLTPVHRCARSVWCVACAVSWASWLLFAGVPAPCVALRARCPGSLGSCSPVCPLGVLCCVCGVLGPLAPAHRCARSVCCVACAVSWATWLLFTSALARCVALRARCPGPLGSCWGADDAGAKAHTHAKDTRGIPEGQPDRARGTHRPRGMAYQGARVRDTRMGRPATRSAGHAGREGGNGRGTTPGTGPSPPNRPRAPRTHGRGTAPAKEVVAHSATPQPLGQAASAPAQGGPTGDKPVARARRRRHPGQPRIRGATWWVSARSHGCESMH